MLTGIYGLPAGRTVEVLEGCGSRKLAQCLRDKQATFSADWEFRRKDDTYLISVQLVGEPDDTVGLLISYSDPEWLRAHGNPGL